MTSKTETPDIVERLRRDLETLRPYIGRPIGALGSDARLEQENKQAAYVEAVEIIHNLADEIERLRTRAEKAEAELAKHQWRTIVDAATDDFDAPEDIDLLLGWFDGPAWRIEIGTAWSSYDGWQTTATHWQPLPSPPGENDG